MFVGEQRGPGFYLNAAVECTNADNPNERIIQPSNYTVFVLIQHPLQVKAFGQIISFTLRPFNRFFASARNLKETGIGARHSGLQFPFELMHDCNR